MRLPADVRDDLLAHAREGAPEEVCGVLGGTRDDGGSFAVETARRVPNVADRPRVEYTLDAEAQLAAMEAIEDAGLDVVGFYHSHPRGPPRPSATDRRTAAWDDRSYLIVALADEFPFVGSWRWRAEAGEFEAETVRVE